MDENEKKQKEKNKKKKLSKAQINFEWLKSKCTRLCKKSNKPKHLFHQRKWSKTAEIAIPMPFLCKTCPLNYTKYQFYIIIAKFLWTVNPMVKQNKFLINLSFQIKRKTNHNDLSFFHSFIRAYFARASSVTLRKRAVISFGRVTAEPITTAYGLAAQTFSSWPTSQMPPSAITFAFTEFTSVRIKS